MNITVNTAKLRPSTIAAMIADLLETPSIDNVLTIRKLIDALEIIVGEEESIEYLCDAGITPEQISETLTGQAWETVTE